MHIRKIAIAILLGSFLATCAAKNIIWDCGNVLFKPDKFSMTYYEIGIGSILWHMVTDLQNPQLLQQKSFYILSNIPSLTQGVTLYGPNKALLPLTMVDWLSGQEHPLSIIEKAEAVIEDLSTEEYFASEQEVELIRRIIKAIFTPDILAAYTQPIPGAVKLVTECARNGCQQFIASNWDEYSFDILYNSEHGQKIFQHISQENIFISGTCKQVKPHQSFYQLLVEAYDFDFEDCIFIDDQLENVEAARAYGITSYWFDGDYKKLRKHLIEEGFLVLSAQKNEKVHAAVEAL